MKELLYKAKAINRNPNMNYRTNHRNGDWVYGLVSKIRGDIAEMTNTDGVSGIDVDRNTICEYAGLTDKNGNKIFDGDIVRFAEYKNGKACWIGEVFFSCCMFQIKGKANEECGSDFIMQLSSISNERIEVIGNIYDDKVEK